MDEYPSFTVESVAPLLAAFDAVAREGHVTRAADRLQAPQSSISRRIRTLEKILGVALLQPSGRGVTLTSSGRTFHQRTQHVMRDIDDAVAAVRSEADPNSGTVRFGFPHTLGARQVSTVLNEFHRKAPRIRVHVVQAHGEALAAMIRDGRLDVAVAIPPPPGLDCVSLGSQQILVHVAADHPLAGRASVSVDELADERFVASPPEFHLRALLESLCVKARFVPRVPFEINDIDTIRALVGSGLGVAVLPESDTEDPAVVAIPVAGDCRRDIGLATGSERPTPAVTRFREHLLDYFASTGESIEP